MVGWELSSVRNGQLEVGPSIAAAVGTAAAETSIVGSWDAETNTVIGFWLTVTESLIYIVNIQLKVYCHLLSVYNAFTTNKLCGLTRTFHSSRSAVCSWFSDLKKSSIFIGPTVVTITIFQKRVLVRPKVPYLMSSRMIKSRYGKPNALEMKILRSGRIMNYHHLVNDTFDHRISISWNFFLLEHQVFAIVVTYIENCHKSVTGLRLISLESSWSNLIS